jgi:periplasmic divalent cation tolerance protein
MSKTKAIFIYIACKTVQEARKIAGYCVTERLVASGNILPQMESIYWWDGTINAESETVLILKTVENNFDAIEKAVLKLHSYDCPCIVALPVSNGYEDYMNWIEEHSLVQKNV